MMTEASDRVGEVLLSLAGFHAQALTFVLSGGAN